MLSWKFYSQRKGITLKEFLKDVRNIDRAYLKFESMGLEPPPHSELEEIYPIMSKLYNPNYRPRGGLAPDEEHPTLKEAQSEKKPRRRSRKKKVEESVDGATGTNTSTE